MDSEGYPVVSKEQAKYIKEAGRSESSFKLRVDGIRKSGERTNGSYIISKCHRYLLDAPFKISERCCDVMKKNPAKSYEKKTGNALILGTGAGESKLRKQS